MLAKIKKIIFLVNSLAILIYAKAALAASEAANRLRNIADSAGYNQNLSKNRAGLIMDVIIYALGLLGMIFLSLIIIAGVQWMTAGGNEEKVTKARDRLKNAVIGFVIIMVSYMVTLLLMKMLNQATVQQNYRP